MTQFVSDNLCHDTILKLVHFLNQMSKKTFKALNLVNIA